MKLIPLLACFALVTFAFAAPKAAPGAPAQEASAPEVNYTYNAKVSRVLAGDLVLLDVDLGFGVWLHSQTFKLQGVSAPAMDGPDKTAALKAKSRTQAVLQAGAEVVLLQSIKDKTDKSKIYHAVLWLNGENLNAQIAREAAKK